MATGTMPTAEGGAEMRLAALDAALDQRIKSLPLSEYARGFLNGCAAERSILKLRRAIHEHAGGVTQQRSTLERPSLIPPRLHQADDSVGPNGDGHDEVAGQLRAVRLASQACLGHLSDDDPELRKLMTQRATLLDELYADRLQ